MNSDNYGEKKRKNKTFFPIIDTFVIMEVDSNCLHPSIVSVSRIIHVAFIGLKEERQAFILHVQAHCIFH